MSYLLDTNTVIARLNGDLRVISRLEALPPQEILLCAPVVAELVFGACLSMRKEQNLARIERLTQAIPLLGFDLGAARQFGEVKASLRRRGIAKSDFDIAIAVIAIESRAVLVTNDAALHDHAISGLQVEDWLAPK